MIIPDKVKIGGVVFDVKKNVERLDMGPNYSANILFTKATIEICCGQDEQVNHRDFLHEVVHGIFWNLGDRENQGDEMLVDKLAGALHQLIVDNPEMFKDGL
jgi:hypothetical protein